MTGVKYMVWNHISSTFVHINSCVALCKVPEAMRHMLLWQCNVGNCYIGIGDTGNRFKEDTTFVKVLVGLVMARQCAHEIQF